jgi:hypothetical protein
VVVAYHVYDIPFQYFYSFKSLRLHQFNYLSDKYGDINTPVFPEQPALSLLSFHMP